MLCIYESSQPLWSERRKRDYVHRESKCPERKPDQWKRAGKVQLSTLIHRLAHKQLTPVFLITNWTPVDLLKLNAVWTSETSWTLIFIYQIMFSFRQQDPVLQTTHVVRRDLSLLACTIDTIERIVGVQQTLWWGRLASFPFYTHRSTEIVSSEI